jgi:hypothetical protein
MKTHAYSGKSARMKTPSDEKLESFILQLAE